MLRMEELFFLVLIISIVLGEFEHQQIGTIKYGVKLEPFHHVMKRQANQPFRITFYYDDSVETGIDLNTRSRIQNVIVPRLKTFLESALMVRQTNAPILLERDCTGGTFFPSNTSPIQCSSTCANVTMCGPLVQVPSNHLKRCIECNDNSITCEAVGTDGTGVNNTDFLLYVSSINSSDNCVSNSDGSNPSTIAFAGACQMENSLDRPIAGYVNFCPSALANIDDDTLFIIVKHEILHALAFSSSLFPFWRDSNGTPRTYRDEFGFPPKVTESGRTRFTWNDSTIQEVTYNDWIVFNGTTTHKVYIMVTPNVVKEGRRHFNCSSLEGVELENQGGLSTALSHWEKRILGNEIMTGIIGDGPVVSSLTFALLKDSGWYEVNDDYVEYLTWGKDAGCTFATSSCLQYMNERRDINQSITPFCDHFPTAGGVTQRGCTVDRDFGALCNLGTYQSNIPSEYRYFSNPNEGGTVFIADYCPYQKSFIFQSGRGNECSDPDNQPPETSFTTQNVLSETYGNGSKCFNHNNQWTLRGNSISLFGAGCYLYSCDANNTELTVYVRGTPYQCHQPGNVVNVNSGGNMGQLTCPSSFVRLCQEAVFVQMAPSSLNTLPTSLITTHTAPSPLNIHPPVNTPLTSLMATTITPSPINIPPSVNTQLTSLDLVPSPINTPPPVNIQPTNKSHTSKYSLIILIIILLLSLFI